MEFWATMTVMCSFAAVLISVPLIRRYEYRQDVGNEGSRIFVDQLKEVERDRELGMIANSDADSAKAEIERRLLSAAKNMTAPRPVSATWRTVSLVAVASLVILGSVNIYYLRGRPDLIQPVPSTAGTAASTAGSIAVPAQVAEATAGAAGTMGEVDGMIGQLAKRLEENPKDADGWRMLGWSYFNTQRYEESSQAYAKAVELVPTNLDYKAGYAEALVQAAQGIVTPKAQAIFAEVLKGDAKEERARFYDALAKEQAGELSQALDGWLALLADAPKNAGWVPEVKQRVVDLGKQTGRDVSASLQKPDSVLPDLGGSNVSEQQPIVASMIGKLSAKLEANPRDRDGWAMMIRSLKVSGDIEGARAALAKATSIFQDDESTRTQLLALAQSLGVAPNESTATVTTAPPVVGNTPTAPQISQEQMAAVQALPADDQQSMIQGMVQRLAEKLAESPHDADGWVRLIRARMVLNQPALAQEALKKAVAEFASDATAAAAIVSSARDLGVVLN